MHRPEFRIELHPVVSLLLAALALGAPACLLEVGTEIPVDETGAQSVDVTAQALEIADSITITNVASLNAKRTALIQHIWGQPTLNTTETGITDTLEATSPIPGLPNLKEVRKYRFEMATPGGEKVIGLAYHYIPQSYAVNKLVVVHAGHSCGFQNDGPAQLVGDLLADGYAVLGVHQPGCLPGAECKPSSGQDQYHDKLFKDPALRPTVGSAMRYFLDPTRRPLNYIKAKFSYTEWHMTGLSGGGMTTVVYAAVDPRIQISVPVSGTLPFYMHKESPQNPGGIYYDLEQTYDPTFNTLYGIAAFKDLYVLGSYGVNRRQIQVANRRDSCCFGEAQAPTPLLWAEQIRVYEQEVRNRVYLLGAGSFRVEIDEAATQHEISKNARINVILSELNGAAQFVAAGSTGAAARGMNGNLWFRTTSAWIDAGRNMTGTPVIVANGVSGHTIDIIYRNPYNVLKHAWSSNGTTWTQNASQPVGVVIADPAAISWGPNRIDIVTVGGDYRLYHLACIAGTWQTSATQISATPVVGPATVTSTGPNNLEIFARGHNRELLAWSSNGAGTFTQTTVGGTMKNFPAALFPATGGVRVYAVGQSERLWEAKRSNGIWSWVDLSGVATSAGSFKVFGTPTAMYLNNTAMVFTRVTGNQLGYFAGPTNWSFTNRGTGGVPLVGSPSIASPGVSYIRGSDASAYQSNGTAWTNLGGYLDR